MKQAKIMLSAIGIFAVVGAAFAFNANKYITNFIFTGAYGVNAPAACTISISPATITDGSSGAQVYASTSPMYVGCPLTFTAVLSSDF
jgi:hypothetical protein